MPNEYQLDDFQVRTPTDILGQHIHLVKFDVTGLRRRRQRLQLRGRLLRPDEVQERIEAIRAANGCIRRRDRARNGTFASAPWPSPTPSSAPARPGRRRDKATGRAPRPRSSAGGPTRCTDNAGNDRTLRTVFTHDHFGPSTHQQAGLYAGLVIEPAGSTWFHNETGAQLSANGGPA